MLSQVYADIPARLLTLEKFENNFFFLPLRAAGKNPLISCRFELVVGCFWRIIVTDIFSPVVSDKYRVIGPNFNWVWFTVFVLIYWPISMQVDFVYKQLEIANHYKTFFLYPQL